MVVHGLRVKSAHLTNLLEELEEGKVKVKYNGPDHDLVNGGLCCNIARCCLIIHSISTFNLAISSIYPRTVYYYLGGC